MKEPLELFCHVIVTKPFAVDVVIKVLVDKNTNRVKLEFQFLHRSLEVVVSNCNK